MSDTPHKKCTGPCGQEYPATPEYWVRQKAGKYGLTSKCKICRRIESKDWRNKPEAKEFNRTYQNRPEVKERQKTHKSRPEVKERRKLYRNQPERKAKINAYNKNPEVKERQKTYKSRPEVKEREKVYRKTYRSRPEVKEHGKAYRKNYYSRPEILEKQRVHNHTRSALKKSVSGTYTTAQIKDQLKRQCHKCYYCQKRLQKVKGKYIYHIEHTFPLSRVAGTDIPANSIDYLVVACPACNLSKHDKFPWEWPEGGRLC